MSRQLCASTSKSTTNGTKTPERSLLPPILPHVRETCFMNAHALVDDLVKRNRNNYFTPENKNHAIASRFQFVDSNDVDSDTVRNGILLTNNIKTDNWNEHDSILYVPYLDNNCYTPIVTRLEMFQIPKSILNWNNTFDSIFGIKEIKRTFVYKRIESEDGFVKKLNSVFSQTFTAHGSTTMHMMAFLIMYKMLKDESDLTCNEHRITARFTFVDGVFNYDIHDDCEFEKSKDCVQCRMMYILGYVFGYLECGTSKSTVVDMFDMCNLDNLASIVDEMEYKIYIGLKEIIPMSPRLALKMVDYMLANDIVENLAVFMYMRRTMGNIVRGSNEPNLDGNHLSCFCFGSAIRILIAGMYLAAKSVDDTAKIVSIKYASNSDKNTNDGKWGRLAIRVSSDNDDALKALRIFVTLLNAKSLLECGIISYSVYISVSASNKAAVQGKNLIANNKLLSPTSDSMLKSKFFNTMHLLPCSMIIWESSKIYAIGSDLKTPKDASYIEVKISYAPFLHMENVDIITATGAILKEVIRLLKEKTVYIDYKNRSDTESRLRFEPLKGDFGQVMQVFSYPLSKKFRLGEKGYIEGAFREMFRSRPTPGTYRYPDQVAVNLTICCRTTNEGKDVMMSLITPTSVIHLQNLAEKYRSEHSTVVNADET